MDGDIPVVIEITDVSLNQGQGHRFGFRINYNRIFQDIPDFATWKFIDEFLTDAITCWPADFASANKFPTLRVEGGWSGGVWNRNLVRLFSFGKDGAFLKRAKSTPEYPGFDGASCADEGWKYIDCISPQSEASLSYQCEPPNYVPYLASEAEICGFQDRVPYLVSCNGRAYIIPIKFREVVMGPDGEDRPRATYIYLNEDYFFEFEVWPFHEIRLSNVHYYGFRYLNANREIWPLSYSHELVSPLSPRKPRDIFTNGFVLPFSTWRRSVDSVSNAWSVWPHPPRQVKREQLTQSYVGGTEYKEYCPPSFVGGFSAGIRNESYRMTYCAHPSFHRTPRDEATQGRL